MPSSRSPRGSRRDRWNRDARGPERELTARPRGQRRGAPRAAANRPRSRHEAQAPARTDRHPGLCRARPFLEARRPSPGAASGPARDGALTRTQLRAARRCPVRCPSVLPARTRPRAGLPRPRSSGDGPRGCASAKPGSQTPGPQAASPARFWPRGRNVPRGSDTAHAAAVETERAEGSGGVAEPRRTPRRGPSGSRAEPRSPALTRCRKLRRSRSSGAAAMLPVTFRPRPRPRPRTPSNQRARLAQMANRSRGAGPCPEPTDNLSLSQSEVPIQDRQIHEPLAELGQTRPRPGKGTGTEAWPIKNRRDGCGRKASLSSRRTPEEDGPKMAASRGAGRNRSCRGTERCGGACEAASAPSPST